VMVMAVVMVRGLAIRDFRDVRRVSLSVRLGLLAYCSIEAGMLREDYHHGRLKMQCCPAVLACTKGLVLFTSFRKSRPALSLRPQLL